MQGLALRTSQASMSAATLTQPWRAQGTGPAAAGLQNQVAARKLCSRRIRSLRSQGRAFLLTSS